MFGAGLLIDADCRVTEDAAAGNAVLDFISFIRGRPQRSNEFIQVKPANRFTSHGEIAASEMNCISVANMGNRKNGGALQPRQALLDARMSSARSVLKCS